VGLPYVERSPPTQHDHTTAPGRARDPDTFCPRHPPDSSESRGAGGAKGPGEFPSDGSHA
jgi:hypothetical protein